MFGKFVVLSATAVLMSATALDVSAADVSEKGAGCYGGQPLERLFYDDGNVAGVSSWSSTNVNETTGVKNTNRCVGMWSFIDGKFENAGFCLGTDSNGVRWIDRFDGANGRATGKTMISSDGAQYTWTWADPSDYPQGSQDSFAGCGTWELTGTRPD